jgi:hypothetical protein
LPQSTVVYLAADIPEASEALPSMAGEVRRTSLTARPRMLLLFMPDDHVATAESFREFARLTEGDTVEFSSECGHYAPVCETAAIGDHVRGYLDGDISMVGR